MSWLLIDLRDSDNILYHSSLGLLHLFLLFFDRSEVAVLGEGLGWHDWRLIATAGLRLFFRLLGSLLTVAVEHASTDISLGGC